MDCNLPGSPVHGISQARILERVAIFFSRGSSQLRDETHVFCVSCIAGRFFIAESPQKPHMYMYVDRYNYMCIYTHTHPYTCTHIYTLYQFSISAVTNYHNLHFSCSVLSNSLQPHELQHARPPCPLLTPGVHLDSRPSSP